jgi:hypothetical protein
LAHGLTSARGFKPLGVVAAGLISKVTDAVNEELAGGGDWPLGALPGVGEIWRPALPGSDLLRHGAGDAGR